MHYTLLPPRQRVLILVVIQANPISNNSTVLYQAYTLKGVTPRIGHIFSPASYPYPDLPDSLHMNTFLSHRLQHFIETMIMIIRCDQQKPTAGDHCMLYRLFYCGDGTSKVTSLLLMDVLRNG